MFNQIIGSKEKRLNASNFDVGVAKLLTSIIIDPKQKLNIEYVRINGSNSLEYENIIRIEPNGNFLFEPQEINLDKTIVRELQLKSATKKVQEFMAHGNSLNSEPMLSRLDHVFWSSLDNASSALRHDMNCEEQNEYLQRINDKVLALNSFRILSSNDGKNFKSKVDSLDKSVESSITTTLGLVNALTDASDVNEVISRMAVNENSFSMLDYYTRSFSKIARTSIKNGSAKNNDELCVRDRDSQHRAWLLRCHHFHDFYEKDNKFTSSDVDLEYSQKLWDRYKDTHREM